MRFYMFIPTTEYDALVAKAARADVLLLERDAALAEIHALLSDEVVEVREPGLIQRFLDWWNSTSH